MSTSTTTTADPVAETDEKPTTTPAAQPEAQPATEPETKPVDQPVAASRETFVAELSRFTNKFGAVNGVAWFNAGKTYTEALELHCDALTKANEELAAKLKDTEARLSQVKIGTDPLPTAGLSSEGSKKTIGQMTNPNNSK